jgi:hypothetical protein
MLTVLVATTFPVGPCESPVYFVIAIGSIPPSPDYVCVTRGKSSSLLRFVN